MTPAARQTKHSRTVEGRAVRLHESQSPEKTQMCKDFALADSFVYILHWTWFGQDVARHSQRPHLCFPLFNYPFFPSFFPFLSFYLLSFLPVYLYFISPDLTAANSMDHNTTGKWRSSALVKKKPKKNPEVLKNWQINNLKQMGEVVFLDWNKTRLFKTHTHLHSPVEFAKLWAHTFVGPLLNIS